METGSTACPPVRSEVAEMGARLSNWGRWGTDDELGCVNFITSEARSHAGRLVRTGKSFSLSLPLDRNGPQPASGRRLNPQHVMLQTGTELRAGVQRGSVDGWGNADDMVVMALQCGTHWDALAHAFHDYKMYNDRDCIMVGVDGALKNDISVMSDAIIGRAVLIDVAASLGVPALDSGYRITAGDLTRALRNQAVEVRTGDILLIRTGHLQRIRASGSWEGLTYSDEPGIGLETLPWLYEHEISAVATDNWALEVLPSRGEIMLPVHAVGIVYMGLTLGELFVLDALAADCREDGVFEMLLVAPPLPFSRAVGSPVNPIAMK